MTTQAIDSDPEFFHGLTMWGDGWAAQIRDGESALVLSFTSDTGSQGEYHLTAAEVRRLRDLLNIATARGFL